jgi:hypothetical protein
MNDFFTTLFDKDEWVCFAPTVKSTRAFALKSKTKRDTEFFTINPIVPHKTRAIKNIEKFRNFLIEIDEDEHKAPVPLEIQEEIIKKCKLPYTTKLFTGNKSMHYIVSLKTPVEDRATYNMYFNAIANIVNNAAEELGYNIMIDDQVKDPSRMSRCPDALRIVPKKAIQELKEVKERVDLDGWFEFHNVWPHDFANTTVHETPDMMKQVNHDASVDDKVDFVLNHMMKKMEYVQGQMNKYQFTFARCLRRTGLTEDQVRNIIIGKFGKEDERHPVRQAFSDKYDSDEPIYVLSKQEKREWAEKQDVRLKTEAEEQLKRDGKEDEILHVNGIQDYIRVGTKYYKLESDRLVLWNADTLKVDFGKDILIRFPETHKYSSFCNVVDYQNPVKRIGKDFNLFEPNHITPVKGDWSTIYKLLCKVFRDVGDDQLKEGIEWIRKAYIDPSHVLHCLVIASGRETGKDTFVNFLRLVFGRSNTWFDTLDKFDGNFNAAYCSKVIIAINEVTNPKYYNKQLIERIKTYVTQKTVNREEKFGTPTDVDYYGKMVMLTNNSNDFLDIDDDENRFWIRSMPYLDKTGPDFDPDFEAKVEAEIPHFLYFMLNEAKPLYTKKQSRFWLPESVTKNKNLETVQENSKSTLYFEIKNIFDEVFSQNKKLRDQGEVYFTSAALMRSLPDRVQQRTGLKQLRMCLQKEFVLVESKQMKPDCFDDMTKKNTKMFTLKVSSVYEHLDNSKLQYGVEDPFKVTIF